MNLRVVKHQVGPGEDDKLLCTPDMVSQLQDFSEPFLHDVYRNLTIMDGGIIIGRSLDCPTDIQNVCSWLLESQLCIRSVMDTRAIHELGRGLTALVESFREIASHEISKPKGPGSSPSEHKLPPT